MTLRRVWADKREWEMQDWAVKQWQKVKEPSPGVCKCCGKVGPVHGHHPSYFRPFFVIWVCTACHTKITWWTAAIDSIKLNTMGAIHVDIPEEARMEIGRRIESRRNGTLNASIGDEG